MMTYRFAEKEMRNTACSGKHIFIDNLFLSYLVNYSVILAIMEWIKWIVCAISPILILVQYLMERSNQDEKEYTEHTKVSQKWNHILVCIYEIIDSV